MKVWITKYCLTYGIQEIEAEICKTNNNSIKRIKKDDDWFNCDEYYYGEGKEWHTTKESAVKRANEIKLKKIESLKKQLIKIESLKFE